MISLIFLGISVGLRCFYVFYGKFIPSTDEYFHFYYARLIKKNHHHLPVNSPHILGTSAECSYPYFYHWILSFFPEKSWNLFSLYSALIYDVISAFLIIHLYSKFVLNNLDINMYFLSIAFYIISPSLTFFSIGPRSFHLTPRNFSQLINVIFIYFLLLGYINYNLIYWVIAVFFCALNLLTSKFVFQVYFFCCVFLGFIRLSIIPGVFFVCAIILSVLLSKGFFVKQLKFQLYHLIGYFRYPHCYQERGNWIKLFLFIIHGRIRSVWYEIIFNNPLLAGITRNFDLIFFIFFQISIRLELIFQILLTMLLSFILTSFGKTRVMGEAERYLEYAFPLKWLLLLHFISQSDFLLFFIGCIYIFYYIYSIYSSIPALRLREDNKILHHLPKRGVILSLNNSEAFKFQKEDAKIICDTFCNTIFSKEAEEFTKWFLLQYPYVNSSNFQKICTKYDVTHVVFNKESGKILKKNFNAIYNFAAIQLIYEDDNYSIYLVK